jgi:hypothetical protein
MTEEASNKKSFLLLSNACGCATFMTSNKDRSLNQRPVLFDDAKMNLNLERFKHCPHFKQ